MPRDEMFLDDKYGIGQSLNVNSTKKHLVGKKNMRKPLCGNKSYKPNKWIKHWMPMVVEAITCSKCKAKAEKINKEALAKAA